MVLEQSFLVVHNNVHSVRAYVEAITMKISINGVERYFDGRLHEALEIYKKIVANKWDGVFYIGGYEGDGKSEFAGQLAHYFDPTYCLERCVFTPEQFMKAVDEAEEGEAVVYDEAQDAFESVNRDTISRALKSKMTRIRKKRLYIIIVAPDFWRINKYMFIHRARAFFRVYANGLQRGFFEFYNRERKHRLMIEGKKKELLCVKPNFRGRFTHWFPLDEQAYDKKKEEATKLVGKETGSEDKQLYEDLRGKVLDYEGITNQAKADILGISDRHARHLRSLRREKKGEEGRS